MSDITTNTLKQYSDFQEFVRPTTSTESNESHKEIIPCEAQTPDDQIESAFSVLKKQLASDLLEQIMQRSPVFFERLVLNLLLKMGYGNFRKDAGNVVGKTGDGGIDGIIQEDKLGLSSVYIQAKRYGVTVPIEAVRSFAGAIGTKHSRKGVMITTSDFPKNAHEFVAKNHTVQIVLIDGIKLAELLIEHNVGVSVRTVYEVKRIDIDYFNEMDE